MAATRHVVVDPNGWVTDVVDRYSYATFDGDIVVQAANTVGIGWMYADGKFQAPGGSKFEEALIDPTVAQQNQRAVLDTIHKGLKLTSPGSPWFDETYSLDVFQRNILRVAVQYFLNNGFLPGKRQVCLVTVSLVPVIVRDAALVFAAEEAIEKYFSNMETTLRAANAAGVAITVWPVPEIELSV